jgi:hypothetical protein
MHRVTFQYIGWKYYPEVFGVTLLALIGAIVVHRRSRLERWGD